MRIFLLFLLSLPAPFVRAEGLLRRSQQELFPEPVRVACRERFPDYPIQRVVEHRKHPEDKPGPESVYRVTLLDPCKLQGGMTGDDFFTEIPLYTLEMTGDGRILEESLHTIDDAHVPDAVLASYRRWNAKGLKGMGVAWSAERKKGAGRMYFATIIVSAVESYAAAFGEDGLLVDTRLIGTAHSPLRPETVARNP